MSKGPCLCGDIYCSSCGDPERAKFEEVMEQLQDDIDGKKMSIPELNLFKEIGFAAVEAHRKAAQDMIADVLADSNSHIDLLEVDSHFLKEQLESTTKQLKEAQEKLRKVQESVGTERSDTNA